MAARRYVWDLPTRLFHWSLVVLLGFSWWSAEAGHMDWHRISGITVLGLILFRLLWGLFGSSTARFGQFIRGPRAIWAYLRPGDIAPRAAPLGHNPLGGWSVLALLFLLCVQLGSGLFAVDVDGIESGPFSYLVDFDTGRWAASLHGYAFTGLQILVALHVAAILFYLLVKRRNLTWTMIRGSERAGAGDVTGVAVAPWWRLLVAIGAAAGVAGWIGYGFS